MKIALDLEGTLIAECGEFPCEPTGALARLVLPNTLRRGARPLLTELRRAGHSLTLYSSGTQSPVALWLWCRLTRLPFTRIVTAAQEQKRARKRAQKQQKRFAHELKALGLTDFGKPGMLAWPPAQGHDLLLDDEPRHIQAAWRMGVKGILITNVDADWTARIREAALPGHDIELPTQTQAA